MISIKQLMQSACASAKNVFSHLKKEEVAETLLATWCVEYLRVRRLGGFHVVEIIAVSILMLGIRAIVTEASKRRNNGNKRRTYVVSTGDSQMGSMDQRFRNPADSPGLYR